MKTLTNSVIASEARRSIVPSLGAVSASVIARSETTRRSSFTKTLSRLFALFGVVMAFAVLGWGADECGGMISDSDFSVVLSTTPYEKSDSVSKFNNDTYYFTAPSAGTVTITLTGTNVAFTSSLTACPGSSSGVTSQTIPLTSDLDFNVNVYDTTNNASSKNYTLTVTFTPAASPQTPPTIAVPDQTATVGSAFSIDLDDYVTLTNGDPITAIDLTGTLPAGLSYDTATHVINGTPTTVETANHSVTATDDDGVSNADDFNITVSPALQPATPPVCIESMSYSASGNISACYDGLIFKGGAGCRQTIKLRNLSDGAITDTNISMDYGFAGNTCGIDGVEGNCTVANNLTVYDPLGDFAAFQAHTIYIDGASVSIASDQPDINMTYYTQDGTGRYGPVLKCVLQPADANDLCIAETQTVTNGLGMCFDFGDFFSGGGATGGCEKQITLRNQSGETLTGISTRLVTDALFDGSMIDSCGIDGISGNCTDSNVMDFGFMNIGGMFMGSSVSYDPLPDFNTGDEHYTYTNSMMSASFFNQSKYFGTYIKDGQLYAGELHSCGTIPSPLTYNPGVVDAIDIYAQTATTPFYDAIIKTKIAGQTNVTLDAVYLGTDMTADTVYNAADMPVLMSIYYPALNKITKLYEADGVTPLAAVIAEGEISGTTPPFTIPASATKEAYILMKYIDYEALLTEGGPNCLQHSSTGANAVPGLPSCVSSDVQYLDAFHQEAFDRCKESNGKPCEPSHHGFSGGGDPTYPGYNPLYDHKYGCYECTLGATPQVRSVDNFAIRPKDFDLNISSQDFPNLLRAGQDYNVSLTARNYNGTTSGDYNITDHNWVVDLDANTTKYFKDDTIDTAGLLHGNAEVNTSVTAYSLGGLSGDSNTTVPSLAEAVIPVSYDDVGKVNLKIYDTVWSAVDNDDTPMDCNDSHPHTYVCSDKNVTFIPHHFNVENIHLRNHRDGNLTYLSNDLNMSAHIDANISARNADNGITQNFRANDTNQFYENPVSVDLNVTEWNASQPSRHPTGNAVIKQDIPTQILLGFGGSDEANGTHSIAWNDANESQRLMFNYVREMNGSVNPFDVPGTDINVSVKSTYSDGSTPSSPADINGTGIGDRNATFYFGRAKSSQYLYDDVTANSVDTPISVVVYDDPSSPSARDLTLFTATEEIDWYLSTPHMSANNDGNISLAVSAGTINGTPATNVPVTIVNGINNPIVNVGYAGARPFTVNITFGSNTNSWLIYNEDNDSIPNPFYRVRFIGSGGSWTGQGETGHVVGDEIKKEKTKRLGW